MPRISRPGGRVPHGDAGTGLSGDDERDLNSPGSLTFADHLLDGAAASIERATRATASTIKIVTGDNELVTRHVCGQVGLDAGRIVLGADIERMTDSALRPARRARDGVRAGLAGAKEPHHPRAQGRRARGRLSRRRNQRRTVAARGRRRDLGRRRRRRGARGRRHHPARAGLDVLHAGIIAGRHAFGNVLKYLLMGTSSNFGNMFSMAGARCFCRSCRCCRPRSCSTTSSTTSRRSPSRPTTSTRLRSRRPQRWDIGVIRRFMLFVGPISSIYDFLTFCVLLAVPRQRDRLSHGLVRRIARNADARAVRDPDRGAAVVEPPTPASVTITTLLGGHDRRGPAVHARRRHARPRADASELDFLFGDGRCRDVPGARRGRENRGHPSTHRNGSFDGTRACRGNRPAHAPMAA